MAPAALRIIYGFMARQNLMRATLGASTNENGEFVVNRDVGQFEVRDELMHLITNDFVVMFPELLIGEQMPFLNLSFIHCEPGETWRPVLTGPRSSTSAARPLCIAQFPQFVVFCTHGAIPID